MFDPEGHIRLSDFGLASVSAKLSGDLGPIFGSSANLPPFTAPTFTGRMTHHVTRRSYSHGKLVIDSSTDYEQQRRQLLHKHGIDLDDGNGLMDGTKTRRMDKKDIELLLGNGNGQDGIFTWREKNRRKVR